MRKSSLGKVIGYRARMVSSAVAIGAFAVLGYALIAKHEQRTLNPEHSYYWEYQRPYTRLAEGVDDYLDNYIDFSKSVSEKKLEGLLKKYVEENSRSKPSINIILILNLKNDYKDKYPVIEEKTPALDYKEKWCQFSCG